MAPQIDFLARAGMIESDVAFNHPDRQCLTSVLAGRDIARIDCPETATELRHGDIVIAASDGLQFLEDSEISDVLSEHGFAPSARISAGLLRALEQLDDPDQDNVSFCVIKVLDAGKQAGEATQADNVTILTPTDKPDKPDMAMLQPTATDRRA